MLNIVIPAAGQGTRMKSLGPKSLLKLGGERVIERQLRLLTDVFPRSRVVVVGGFQWEKLRRFLPKSVRVVVNKAYETTNVAYSVALGINHCHRGPVLVVYGDLVFGREALSLIDTKRSAVVVGESESRSDEVGVGVVGGEVVNFSYGLDKKWAHIAMLTKREKEMFQQIARGRHWKRKFGYEVLNEIIDKGGRFDAIEPADMELNEIDTPGDLSAVLRRIAA